MDRHEKVDLSLLPLAKSNDIILAVLFFLLPLLILHSLVSARSLRHCFICRLHFMHLLLELTSLCVSWVLSVGKRNMLNQRRYIHLSISFQLCNSLQNPSLSPFSYQFCYHGSRQRQTRTIEGRNEFLSRAPDLLPPDNHPFIYHHVRQRH